MKTIYETNSYQEIQNRLNKLSANSQRQWGTMEVAQMMAHCSKALEVSTGQKKNPRRLLGRILGPLFKKDYLSEKPFSQNSPTDKNFIITHKPDFDVEKLKLKELLKLAHEGGEAKAIGVQHSFFGHLTPSQWGISIYKHLDHHLRQFGV